ncbi:LysR substrate-binding domain-containing protein [Mameliella sediminis]|uniref:LysR substrate-binding domain-containing protein n=1 Tax=Mameliella sediminis TaxID=2836866 RepID=UPI001CD2B59E|nr:LysR substrate-binding domain-containing protein [Mameliella sediminis]MCA0955849.1 LysR family transcriptional regulator [Mameliella alba]
MGNLRNTLTRLPHLITFEAASRKGNFTRAAEELGVTRVSVSRQIGELEETLGTPLFHREHRKVTLTQAGRALAAEVSPALNQIASALQSVAARAGDNRLTVTTTSAFATYWLMPRLVGFSNLHPEIELNLVVSDRKLDLETEGVDVAIRYSAEPPAFRKVTPLLRERVFPVVSPKYRARTALQHPKDLLNETLLHLSGIYRPGARWPNWFRKNDLTPPSEASGVVMNTYINMLQAAIAGHGVALAGNPLVDPYLADGSLRRLDGFREIERDHFYLIDTTDDRRDAAVFCAWLTDQAQGAPTSDAP